MLLLDNLFALKQEAMFKLLVILMLIIYNNVLMLLLQLTCDTLRHALSSFFPVQPWPTLA